jgi:hypothetical protein
VLLRDSPFPLSAVIPELWQAARAERADRQRCLRALVQRLAIGRPWLVGQPVLDASARAVAAGDAEFGSRAMALRQTASSGRGTRRLTRRGLRELPPHLEEHLHSVRFHEWRPTGEHNVQGGAETVDVRGGTDQVKALRRMLWAHELRRARRRSRNGLVRRTAGRRGQRLPSGPSVLSWRSWVPIASCAATDRAAAQIFGALFLSQVTDCVATLDWLGWSPLRLKARKSHAWPIRSNAGSSCKRYLGAHK